jgi:hypothetical protein
MRPMSVFDAVDGARSAASKCYKTGCKVDISRNHPFGRPENNAAERRVTTRLAQGSGPICSRLLLA